MRFILLFALSFILASSPAHAWTNIGTVGLSGRCLTSFPYASGIWYEAGVEVAGNGTSKVAGANASFFYTNNVTSKTGFLYRTIQSGSTCILQEFEIPTCQKQWVMVGTEYWCDDQCQGVQYHWSDPASAVCGVYPTCNNGTKQPEETGVDCGGPCNTCGEGLEYVECPPGTERIDFSEQLAAQLGADAVCGHITNQDQAGNCPNGYYAGTNTAGENVCFDAVALPGEYAYNPDGSDGDWRDTPDPWLQDSTTTSQTTASPWTDNQDGTETQTTTTTKTTQGPNGPVTETTTTTTIRNNITKEIISTNTTTTGTTGKDGYFDTKDIVAAISKGNSILGQIKTGVDDLKNKLGQLTDPNLVNSLGPVPTVNNSTYSTDLDAALTQDVDWDQLYGTVNSSGIVNAIGNSQISASGNCSFSANVLGSSVQFSICGFESTLSWMGSFLIGLSTLFGFFILVGRE